MIKERLTWREKATYNGIGFDDFFPFANNMHTGFDDLHNQIYLCFV